jgi:hypothetical protein
VQRGEPDESPSVAESAGGGGAEASVLHPDARLAAATSERNAGVILGLSDLIQKPP